MKPEYTIIFTLSFFLPLFYFALLISKKEKFLSDKVLAFLLLAIGLHLFSSYLKNGGYWDIYPHLVGLSVPLPFVYGPLVYLYIYYARDTSLRFDKKKLIHFIPFLLVAVYMSRFYFFYSVEEKRLVDAGKINDFDTFTNIIFVVIFVSIIYYVIKSIKLIIAYKKSLDNNFSNKNLLGIKWFRGFVLGFGGFFFIVIVVSIVKAFITFQNVSDNDVFFNFLLLFLFLVFGFYGIRNQNLFSQTKLVKHEATSNSLYENSGLKKDLAKEKHKELLEYMDKEKPYLDAKLSLNMLAEKLGISPNYLSQIINQFEKQNFNDFTNRYRVNEFISRASANQKYNLLTLAFDSGFNSKSTFNTAFKKQKGLTPSQYLKSIKVEP